MISYLSKPLESQVAPYQENIDLISKVGMYKQSRYDSVVDTMLQKQNDLLNLDTLNEQVTSDKNNLLKIADQQLNELAKVDLLNPENINKAEAIFQPITSNKSIMEDVYYTKKIRENQEFAQQTLKKDPSIGNQKNFNTSQEFVELYRKADKNNLSEVAAYTTMFAPYIDVKGKVTKLLTELKVLNPQEFKTSTDVQGVLQEYIKKGKITKDQVLQKVNAIFTPEDKYQLMLDGYGDYGNYDIGDIIGSMGNYKTNINEINKSSEKILEQIKLYDPNGDGEIDKITGDSVIDSTNQELLNEYYSEKQYLDQQKQSYTKGIEYINKYEQTKDLSIGDRLGLFQFLKETEITNDITSLFQTDYTNFEFKYSDKDLFKFQTDKALEDYKSTKKREDEAAKKAEEEGALYEIDVNQDGNPEYKLGAGKYPTTNMNIDEQTLEDIYDVKDINNFQRFKFDGQEITVNIGSTGIKNWESVFAKTMEGAALDGKAYINENLNAFAIGTDGTVDEEIQKALQAGYETFKKAASTLEENKKPITKENIAVIDNDKHFQIYNEMYEFEKNFKSGNDLNAIKTSIESHLLNDRGFKQALLTKNNEWKGKIASVVSKSDIRSFIAESHQSFPEIVKSDKFLSDLVEIQVSKMDTPESIIQTIRQNVKEKGYDVDKLSMFIGHFSSSIYKHVQIENQQKLAAIDFHREKQDIYKVLLSKFSPLIINYPAILEAKEKDNFYRTTEALINGWQDLSSIKVMNSEQKWESMSKEQIAEYVTALKDGKTVIKPKSYNTGTGELIASIEGAGIVKYDLNPKTATENKMPYGLPTGDIVGKNLILQTILDPKKTYSSIISAGVLKEGDVTQPMSIFYDPKISAFKLVMGDTHAGVVKKIGQSTTELLGYIKRINTGSQPTLIETLNGK